MTALTLVALVIALFAAFAAVLACEELIDLRRRVAALEATQNTPTRPDLDEVTAA